MKRALSLILALLLCGAALAEPSGEVQPQAEVQPLGWSGGTEIDGTRRALDLNGDGDAEEVYLETIPDEFESFQRLHVSTAGDAEAVFDAEIISGARAWACDLDHDGVTEIFLWGDVMSDDYFTWCLHYDGGRLAPVLFADTSRGESGQGYYKSGYGLLEAVDADAGTVTLCGSQDMLGTYFMSRTLALSADGLFEFADDGIWVRNGEIDDEMWDGGYSILTARVAVPYEDADGNAAALEPGDKLAITGTDKASMATFVTRDGRTGRFAISEDYARGWGSLVGDIPEDDAFEFVPYAD